MKKVVFAICLALLMSTGVAIASVNVNTAGAEALAQLPGIGQARAQAIIDYRKTHEPFDSLSELNDVKGIGDATVAGLKGKATTGQSAEDKTETGQAE